MLDFIMSNSKGFLFKFKSYSLIQVKGKEAKLFLQSILSADLNQVQTNLSLLGLMCQLDGKVEALFRIFKLETNHYLLKCPKDIISLQLESLKKYAMFSEVEIINNENDYKILASIGDGIKRLNPLYSSSIPDRVNECFSNKNMLIVKIDNEPPRYEIIISADFWQDFAFNIVLDHPKEKAWFSHHIDHLMPEIFLSARGLFLPHYINLIRLDTVSFNKGCFKGQEILARMQHLGNIKKKLYRFKIDNYKEGNSKIETGEKIVDKNSLHIFGRIVFFVEICNEVYGLIEGRIVEEIPSQLVCKCNMNLKVSIKRQ